MLFFLLWACAAAVVNCFVVGRSGAEAESTEAGIACVGHLPPVWKEWSARFQSPVARKEDGTVAPEVKTLAHFCASKIGVVCAKDGLEFPLLLQLQADAGQGVIRTYGKKNLLPLSDAYLDGGDFRHVQMATEFCRSKCGCASLDASHTSVVAPRLPVPTNDADDQNVLEWDFDKHHAHTRARSSNEIVFPKSGDVIGVGKLSQRYVGAQANSIVCDSQEFTKDLAELFYLRTRTVFVNDQDICAHRYYGGNKELNMGGICLHDQAGKAQVTFPYELKSPFFTREKTGSTSTFPGLVESFCKRHCRCTSKSDMPTSTSSSVQGLALLSTNNTTDGECYGASGSGLETCGIDETRKQEYINPPVVPVTQPLSSNMTCPARCEFVSGSAKPMCGPNSETGCYCRAFQSIDPVVPPSKSEDTTTMKFIAVCVGIQIVGRVLADDIIGRTNNAIIHGLLDGRDIVESDGTGRQIAAEEFPCPCNASYVSFQCCDSDSSGIIWEEPQFNMGKLHPDWHRN